MIVRQKIKEDEIAPSGLSERLKSGAPSSSEKANGCVHLEEGVEGEKKK